MHIEASHSEQFEHPAHEAWEVLGGFNGLPAISSNTMLSRLEDDGRIRVLANSDGSVLWERLLYYSDTERILRYEIVDTKAFGGAYGVGYVGEVRVREADGGSVFDYRGRFEPVAGFSDEEAEAAVKNFAADCANGVRRILALRA